MLIFCNSTFKPAENIAGTNLISNDFSFSEANYILRNLMNLLFSDLYQIDLTPIRRYHVLGFPARFPDATGVNPGTRGRRARLYVVRRRSEVGFVSRNRFYVLTKLCSAFFKLSLYDVRLSLRLNTSIVCRVCTAWYCY